MNMVSQLRGPGRGVLVNGWTPSRVQAMVETGQKERAAQREAWMKNREACMAWRVAMAERIATANTTLRNGTRIATPRSDFYMFVSSRNGKEIGAAFKIVYTPPHIDDPIAREFFNSADVTDPEVLKPVEEITIRRGSFELATMKQRFVERAIIAVVSDGYVRDYLYNHYRKDNADLRLIDKAYNGGVSVELVGIEVMHASGIPDKPVIVRPIHHTEG